MVAVKIEKVLVKQKSLLK